MNISIHPHQVVIGFVAGLIAAPGLQSLLSQLVGANTPLPMALTVIALGAAIAAVAGQGKGYLHKMVPTRRDLSSPALTPLEFAAMIRTGRENHSIRERVVLELSEQVQDRAHSSVADALRTGLFLARQGRHAPLRELNKLMENNPEGNQVTMLDEFYARYRSDEADTFHDRIVAAHAFSRTRLVAHFVGSTAATADFTWLKRVDRGLWYALNNVGRRAFHVEGIGVIEHYLMEKRAGTQLGAPMIEVSVNRIMASLDTAEPPSTFPSPIDAAGEKYMRDLDLSFCIDSETP